MENRSQAIEAIKARKPFSLRAGRNGYNTQLECVGVVKNNQYEIWHNCEQQVLVPLDSNVATFYREAMFHVRIEGLLTAAGIVPPEGDWHEGIYNRFKGQN